MNDSSFLDNQQYTVDSIKTYESVYGRDFVSPGGRESALELTSRLALEPGQRVLDVGCGLGGGAFLMASEYGAVVDGVDLSRNMIGLAQVRAAELGLHDSVNLIHGDCLELECSDEYDAIYSRDVFVHIHDKQRLFCTLRRLLRPGGKLLFTDYCCSPPPWTSEFEGYVEQRDYCLHTVSEYETILIDTPFRSVRATDKTDEFTAILRADLSRILETNLDESHREALRVGWQAKIDRSTRGEQRWGLFEAEK